jgi:hypothetical protein
MTIRDQACHEVDRKVGGTPMPGMLDLHQVFELVKYGFHEDATTQHHLIVPQEQLVRHIALEVGH